ncbi:hypothetical protein [Burkholderia ubonensis]|uniref:hypothetical protein n=1 Tax=Burkholderia ubonensis TaxID=101571 RepID=UPI00075B99F9|nr:hypothetical protein [Burkholderia ubonensis]KWN63601.1 hypothetical protein WM23_12635 [Burkholderia ubonensis]
MPRINANAPPLNLYAEVDGGGELKQISQRTTSGAGEAIGSRLISTVAGIRLNEAQELALTNGRLFEAALSMAILDHPGDVGRVYQDYAHKLATVLESVLSEQGRLTDTPVKFRGEQLPLSKVFELTLTIPLAPRSEQVGRQPLDKESIAVRDWIMTELRSPIIGGDGSYLPGRDAKDLLSRIKMMSAFGTTVWQLMQVRDAPENTAALREMLKPLGNDATEQLADRYMEFTQRTRTTNFDDSVSRMRSERVPLIDGMPVSGTYTSAAQHGLGFGNVMVTANDGDVQERLNIALGKQEGYSNINGIARQGARIEHEPGKLPKRPFMMSAAEIAPDHPAMELYQALLMRASDGSEKTLLEALDAHTYPHGVGVNRWQLTGTFAVESNLRGLPSAGAQSGGTCDVLLALHTLSDTSLYGNSKIIEPATLGIAAFMEFGGYHSAAETIPIGMAMANNDDEFNPSSGTAPVSTDRPIFEPLTTDIMHEGLYDRLANMAIYYTVAPFDDIQAILDAYTRTHEILCNQHPELRDMGTVSIETTRVSLDNQG